MRNTPERLNDGLLFFGTIKTIREKGKKTGESFEQKGRLFFNELTIRQQDVDVSGTATDQSVDLKVKTYYMDGVNKSHKVLIGTDLYDIYMLDKDINNEYFFWYLAKVGVYGEDSADVTVGETSD